MLDIVPSLPWYTWVAVSALLLLLAGVVRVLLAGLTVGISACFHAAWWGVLRWLSSVSSYGTAHWASRREIAQAGLFEAPDGLVLGTWQGQELHEPSGGHVAIFGPSRSRKSWGIIMPNIERFAGSVVISDLRSELFQRTQEAREHLGPCYRFDPAGEDSCSVNILDAVRWSTPYAFGDVHRITTHLLRPGQAETQPTFALAAMPLLTSLILFAAEQGLGNFPALLAWCLAPEESLEEKLRLVLASPNPLVSGGARRCLDMSANLRAAVWSAMLQPLDIFSDPLVASHTAKSDLLLTDLHDAIQPISLYLCMNFADISRLGVFLGALVESLTAILGSPTGTPRHKVLLVLDEIANLGYLPELERAVSYLQGSGTQVVLAFQNIRQAIKTFGEDSPLLSSIACQVHYRPHDTSTAQWVAGYLGQATVTSTSQSPRGETTSEHARPLLTVDEVLRIRNDEALILSQGLAPVRARKLGTPLPTTTTAQVQAWLWRWRWPVGALALALLLLLSLWPLTRLRSPAPPPPVAHAPAVVPPPVVRLPPPPGGAWALRYRQGNGPVQTDGRYPDAAQCQAAMERYAPLLAMAAQLQAEGTATVTVQREPDHWRWSVAWPKSRAVAYDVSCQE